MIKRTVSLFFLGLLTFYFHLSTSYADQLVAVVNGTNVNLDWSEMTKAQSYTLYYALGDFKGDIDVTTLGSVEMGTAKSVYVPNLPSGLIIYTAILAHTNEGDVVSNVAKLIPFGGTVTFPESGDVLIQVEDPGGIGSISVVGTVNSDGKDFTISEISGVDNSGPYALYITDDKPNAFSSEGLTVYFMYHTDGSVGLHTVNDELIIKSNILPRSVDYKSNISIDCSKYESRDKFKSEIQNNENFRDDFGVEMFLQGFPAKMRGRLYLLMIGVARELDVDLLSILSGTKMGAFLKLLDIVFDGIRDEVLDTYLILYEQQCSDKVLFFEYGDCHVPSGAEYDSYIVDNELTEYYTLDDHFAGPFKEWYDTTRTLNELTACYDENGKLHNKRKIFFEWGVTRTVTYNHGVILEATETYPSDELKNKSFYKNGEMIEWISYYDHIGRYKQWIRYKDGLQDGWQELWYENGYQNNSIFYVNGKKEGKWYQYREDGSLSEIRHYKNDLAHGKWTYYDDDGKTVKRICTHENGSYQGCTLP